MNPARWPWPAQAALALLAGAVGVTAFAPFGVGVVALVSLALLFLLWRHASGPAHAALLGYAFGLGLMGFGVSWVRISIAQFGGATPAIAIGATLLFVAFMALYYALAGWLAVRLRRSAGSAWLLLVVPAVWILVEWLRGWLFTGFPWLAVGYSQIDLPLAGLAPLGGVYLVGLALALSAALLLCLPKRLAALGLVGLWAAGFALGLVNWSRPAGEAISVALLQGNVPQAQKWLREMRRPTLALYLGMTEAVPDSRLVIWPETAVPAFASEVQQTLLVPLHARLQAQGRDVLLGIVDGERGGAYFNAMLSLGASGRDRYYKRHLVPFGEYLPFDAYTGPLLDFLDIPMSDFTPGGDVPPLVTLAGHPAGIDICYEDAYANEIIRALPEARFLVNASNDAWFGDSIAPHQHLEIARMRAAETARYLLRATNTGISAIIDPHGRLQGTAPLLERATLSGEILPLTGSTPFAALGNVPVVVLALLMLAAGWRVQRDGA